VTLEIKFNEIQLGQLIGEGGYGKIYQGRWREMTVAVKMLKPSAINDTVVRDFLSECKAM
jgi:serine/threonine protein kinase